MATKKSKETEAALAALVLAVRAALEKVPTGMVGALTARHSAATAVGVQTTVGALSELTEALDTAAALLPDVEG